MLKITKRYHGMISHESVLRNLPSGLNRKQALFFDGLRHAAEITEFSYRRLQVTLATIAMKELQAEERATLFTSAFVDAWSVVDSIDRFRALLQLLPISGHSIPRESPAGIFLHFSQPIRELRNVADHLAQRADYVVAKNGSALGILSWVTIPDASGLNFLGCAIIPGTVLGHRARIPIPRVKSLELPTDLIELTAGEYTGNLSEQLPLVRNVMAEMEVSLDKEFREKGVRDQHQNADILIIGKIEFDATAGEIDGQTIGASGYCAISASSPRNI